MDKIKLIIGAAATRLDGWLSTDKNTLNILDDESWKQFVNGRDVTNILAEHVWEHFSYDDAIKATKNCFKYLSNGGIFRCAVPDGFHPNDEYIKYVNVGNKDNHKYLYNHITLSEVFKCGGFDSIDLLEYFDENHNFHCKKWNVEDGLIKRSKEYDLRNKIGDPLSYTSIIIDGRK